MPDQTSPPQGWRLLPLLQLRAVGVVGPAVLDAVGMIRPQNRKEIVQVLRIDPVTAGIRALAAAPVASAADEANFDTPAPLADWEPTPDGHQSHEHASYRLGGDASAGLSSLVTVQFPSSSVGASVAFTIDIAVSLANALTLGQVARLLRDGLVLVTSALPEVLADLVPAQAMTNHAEVHLLAPPKRTPNTLCERINLHQLGQPPSAGGPLRGCAAGLAGPLTERDAAELVVDACEYMALASGFLDPTVGITLLRQELGLPAGR